MSLEANYPAQFLFPRPWTPSPTSSGARLPWQDDCVASPCRRRCCTCSALALEAMPNPAGRACLPGHPARMPAAACWCARRRFHGPLPCPGQLRDRMPRPDRPSSQVSGVRIRLPLRWGASAGTATRPPKINLTRRDEPLAPEHAPLSRFDLLIYGRYRLVHGLRIAPLAFTSPSADPSLKLPESTWPLITLVVVMGPISFWGNVLPRALQRVVGTIFGAACGVVALYLSSHLPLMLVWCCAIMFLCGYLALGKRPVGLLISITLGSSSAGCRETSRRRSGAAATSSWGRCWPLLFCSIYPSGPIPTGVCRCTTPLQQAGRLYHTHLPPICWSAPGSAAKPRPPARQDSQPAPCWPRRSRGDPFSSPCSRRRPDHPATASAPGDAGQHLLAGSPEPLMQEPPGCAPASRRPRRDHPELAPSCSRAAIPIRRADQAIGRLQGRRPPMGQAEAPGQGHDPPLAATSGSTPSHPSSSPTSIACLACWTRPDRVMNPTKAPDSAMLFR